MKAPCLGCTRRTIEPNCHNVNLCPEWKQYVEEKDRQFHSQRGQRDMLAVEARRSKIIEKQRKEGYIHHE